MHVSSYIKDEVGLKPLNDKELPRIYDKALRAARREVMDVYKWIGAGVLLLLVFALASTNPKLALFPAIAALTWLALWVNARHDAKLRVETALSPIEVDSFPSWILDESEKNEEFQKQVQVLMTSQGTQLYQHQLIGLYAALRARKHQRLLDVLKSKSESTAGA